MHTNMMARHSQDEYGRWIGGPAPLFKVLADCGYTLEHSGGALQIVFVGRPEPPRPSQPAPQALNCRCYSCGRIIEGGVLPETSFSTGQPMVTGCPFCYTSFVD